MITVKLFLKTIPDTVQLSLVSEFYWIEAWLNNIFLRAKLCCYQICQHVAPSQAKVHLKHFSQNQVFKMPSTGIYIYLWPQSMFQHALKQAFCHFCRLLKTHLITLMEWHECQQNAVQD